MTYAQQYAETKEKIAAAEREVQIQEMAADFILRRFCATHITKKAAIIAAKETGDYDFQDAIVMHLLSECKTDAEKDAIIAIDTPPFEK